ncbi:MAG: rhodanese-like domain-containing protein [Candidatus Thiodiazotropha sp. (ex Semelilucina semeliformis)]|nr:rhodanese-like domain-containing protein [Candidatus Thiodiazotropha sp. (ex Myrtea spinifera)]MCU7807714.1 rhodanese-like domain-containing protein [Candidatus Thiodiazotropha sp. (ex Semelilucina semeliformis)]MCU7830436.1 rhodanese-like domain-containing protein [Candidatus Thiodiazotropha sp. (ex Myrtea sp. 'scaly one' KF741663)]
MKRLRLLTLMLLISVSGLASADEEVALEHIQSFLDFATYNEGAITREQLASTDLSQIQFIDTRPAEQYEMSHIPDAMNIDWREILTRKDEIPQNKPVVLYCNTGLASSKAQLILRLSGYENVKVLSGGYREWKATEDTQ